MKIGAHRKLFKTCNKCQIEKHSNFFYKNFKKGILRPRCKACTNKDQLRFSATWKSKNKDRLSGYEKNRWIEKNAYMREKNKRQYLNNLEHNKMRSRLWSKNNPEKACANANKRRASMLSAMPKWISPESLLPVYRLAKEMTISTGIRHEVDHIFPLRGKTMSGLHVPWNLRVITKSENCSKGNRI